MRRSAPRTLGHALAAVATTVLHLVTTALAIVVGLLGLVVALLTAATARVSRRTEHPTSASVVVAPTPPAPSAPGASAQLTVALVGMGFAAPAVRRFVGGLDPATRAKALPEQIRAGLAALAS